MAMSMVFCVYLSHYLYMNMIGKR
jgi:hypothetical protein